MKVLLITYYFPPDAAVGALRVGRVDAALRAAGHDVLVLAAGETGAGSTESRVRRVRPFPTLRQLLLRFRRVLSGARSSPVAESGQTSGPVSLAPVSSWKRFLVSLLVIPDDFKGFVPAALRAGWTLARQEVDVVYTSGPPHSVHLVGLALRLFTRVRWVVEFRDPWTENPEKGKNVRSWLSDAIESWLEARCLAHADRIVTVTQAAGEVFARKAVGARDRIVVARNGIDGPIAPARAGHGHPFRMAYFGNLYMKRDPRPILQAISQLRDRQLLSADTMRFDLYGDCRWFFDVSVEDTAGALGLHDIVHVHDRVTWDESRRLMTESDLLLLFAQDQPLQVPNKLYEYLGTGRPILAIADDQGETAAMLRRIGGQLVVTEDRADPLASALASALRGEFSARDPGADALLEEWSVPRQMDRLLDGLGLAAPAQLSSRSVAGAPQLAAGSRKFR